LVRICMSETEDVSEGALRKPPSRRSSWYEQFFDILSSRKIDSVDLDFVKVNITPDRSDAGKFLQGLRFLGLIDKTGKATKALDKLRLTGDQFNINLQETVKNAYAIVFEKVNLESVKRENLVNFFVGTYDLSSSVADKAVDLFAYFARRADIQVSDELGILPIISKSGRDSTSRRQTNQTRTKSQSTHPDIVPEDIEELKMGDVRVWIPKGNHEAAITAKRLIDLYLETHTSGT